MSLRRPEILGAVLAGLAVLVGGSALSRLGQAQTSANGKELFAKRCGGCHSLDRDKEGPRLHGVYGRPAGSVDSCQYSDALKKSGITWNEESLEKWLADPEQLIPGNDMAFHLESADERREIVAYLKTNSGK